MFNPALVLYALAVGALLFGLSMFPGEYQSPDLPNLFERQGTTPDEYAMIIARYGQPDHVYLSKPLDLINIRRARYFSAHVEIVLVPGGCLGKYGEIMRLLARIHSATPKCSTLWRIRR